MRIAYIGQGSQVSPSDFLPVKSQISTASPVNTEYREYVLT